MTLLSAVALFFDPSSSGLSTKELQYFKTEFENFKTKFNHRYDQQQNNINSKLLFSDGYIENSPYKNEPIIQTIAKTAILIFIHQVSYSLHSFLRSRNYLMQKQEQELTKEKTVWAEQQKKKYLQFITNRLISLKGRVPNNFFIIMSNTILNSKTSRQISDFHKHRKQGCSSIQDLIKKVSKEINQDPAVFIKYHEQARERQKEKISCFEGLKEVKSLTEFAREEFLKDFNPHEIIFKPNAMYLNQILLSEEKKGTVASCDSLHQRMLSTKLYPVKDILDSDQEKSNNSPGQENIISQELTNKKQIIFKKRQQKGEEKPTKTPQLKQSLTQTQYFKFLVFLMYYKSQFSNDSQKKSDGIWNRMQKYLKTRDSDCCKSCWQFFHNKYKDIDGVISYLKRNVNVSIGQIHMESSSIQDFYQQELQRQMVSINPVKLSLWAPGTDNESLIHQIIFKNVEFFSLTEKMGECKLEASEQAFKVQNEQIKVELPIMLEVFLIKKQKQENKNQSSKRKKKEKKREGEDDDEYEDQNEDQYNIDKKKIYRKKQVSDERKKIYRKSQGIYQSDDGIKGNKYVQKIRNIKIKWSISQNIKFVAYLIVNRYYFENLDAKERSGIIIKLAQFLHTDKSVANCSDHLSQQKMIKNNDIKKTIDQKAQKFGLTEQMIEERKQICRQIKTIKTKLGDATLQLDHLPTIIKIQKKYFSEQTVFSKIYESEPFFSFYLRLEEECQIKKNKEDQGNQKLLGQECSSAKELMPSKMVKSILKLAVPEQKFLKIIKNLEKNKKKEDSAPNLDFIKGLIKLKFQVNQIYKVIFD